MVKSRKGLVEEEDNYLMVGGKGFLKEELDDIMDKYDVHTPDGQKNAIDDLQNYMKSSEYDTYDTFGVMTRKGNCSPCRPDNIKTVASGIVSRMRRSISGPSRKGAPAFATGNSGKLMNDVKGFINNDKVSTKLQKTFGTKDQRNQAILKENSENEAKQQRANKVKNLNNSN